MTSSLTEIEARLAALEERVGALASQRDRPVEEGAGVEGAASRGGTETRQDEAFALLETLEAQHPGSVAVVGSVAVDDGPLRWQYALPQSQLMESDWSEAAERFAALGSAPRLAVLRACLGGPRRVAELVEELGFDSLGQLNHHIRVLTAAGWLQSVGRGVVRVPPARAVPLLAVLVAMN